MSLLGPVKNLYGTLARVGEEASTLLGVADSRGITGVLRSVMGLDPEGMLKVVDETLGAGLIEMLSAGDRSGVETTLEYRRYCMDFMGEFIELRDLLVKFDSDEPGMREEALGEMKAIMASRGQTTASARHARALEAELDDARHTFEEIAALAGRGFAEATATE